MRLTLAALVFAALGFTVGAATHGPPGPDVTVCHTRAQTDCLWVNGHAEWH